MDPTVLLLQARYPTDGAKIEEQETFARALGLPQANIVGFDVLERVPSLRETRRFDAVMMGGAGEFDVSKRNLPTHYELMDFLAQLAAVGHPTFASCFGFQFMVEALGGGIAVDLESAEVGTFELTLTPEGLDDPVFRVLPPRFLAQLGRKERAVTFPTSAINLARSDACPYQALRIPGRPVWATQFHPELDRATNLQRYDRYLDVYSKLLSPEQMVAARARFIDSPEAGSVLPRFLEVVFG